MRKYFKLLLCISIVALLFSLCSCGKKDEVSGAFNDAEKEGYTKIDTIGDIEFFIPDSFLKETKDEEYFETTFANKTHTEELETTFRATNFLSQTDREFLLINYSGGFIGVFERPLNEKLETIVDLEGFSASLTNPFCSIVMPEGDFIKHSGKYEKIFASATFTFNSNDTGLSNDIVFKGHIAVIENTEGKSHIIMAGFPEAKQEVSSYIAKSLIFYSHEAKEADNALFAKPNHIFTIKSAESKAKEFDGKLKDFKVMVGSNTIKLATKTSEIISKTKLQLSDTDSGLKLKKNQYIPITLSDGQKSLVVKVGNFNSDKEIPITDAIAFAIVINKPNDGLSNSTVYEDVILPLNVMLYKTTYEQVIELYGEPTETKDNEESEFIYLTWNLAKDDFDIYTKMEITIEKSTNLVYGFEYSKTP